MKNKVMGKREYVLLFAISLVAFYTVLSMIGPLVPNSGISGSTVVGSVASGSGSGVCSGNIQLNFFPATPDVGTRASAIVSGLNNCNDKVVFVRQQTASGLTLKCSCVVSTGNGCGCSFNANGSICNSNTFYAQVDMNGDGSYNDAGESAVGTLNINGCQPV